MPRPKQSARSVGLKYGFRSGLEEVTAEHLGKLGVGFDYESIKLRYVKPARDAKYTPDFVLHNGIIVETKGRFLVEDRQKHLLLKDQHPDLDVRFVFSNSNQRISKGSKTSYAMWCQKHGFQYADKSVPLAWVHEPECMRRLAALKEATVK